MAERRAAASAAANILVKAAMLMAVAAPAATAQTATSAPMPPPPGSLDAYQDADLGPRALVVPVERAVLAAGVSARILEMPRRPGQAFEKDDVLVTFDCATFKAAADGARAQLAAAAARLKSDEQRFSLNAIGQLDLDISKAEYQRAHAETRARDADVRQCTIRAPYSGRVVGFHANRHETVQAGHEVIEIIGDEVLEIEVIVPSTWLRWLQPGAAFAVHLDETGETYSAHVERIAAEVDPASQSVKLIGAFYGRPEGARAGMSGEAVFEVLR